MKCDPRLFKLQMSTTPPVESPEEQSLITKLKEKLNVTDIHVQDISGGCGSMYEVYVSSIDFKGKNRVQQHRLITEILKEDVKTMHGLRIQTAVPT